MLIITTIAIVSFYASKKKKEGAFLKRKRINRWLYPKINPNKKKSFRKSTLKI